MADGEVSPEIGGYERLLTPLEAAGVLGVTVKQLAEWRWKGGGPRFVRVSHKVVMYRHPSLIAWAAAREFRTAHEAKGYQPDASAP